MTTIENRRQVYRYEVQLGRQKVLPEGKILHVETARSGGDYLEVWIEIEPGAYEARTVEIFPTGYPIPNGAVHRGTALMGSFVWHLYELGAE